MIFRKVTHNKCGKYNIGPCFYLKKYEKTYYIWILLLFKDAYFFFSFLFIDYKFFIKILTICLIEVEFIENFINIYWLG